MVFQITRSLLIVDEMVDGRVVATYLAAAALLHLDGAEVHRLGIEGEQSVGQELAHAEEVFQRLGSLDSAQHTCDGSQYACLATGRYGSCWRWLLEEATVAGGAWQVGKGLTLEAEDAAMGEWLAEAHTGVIDEELHREVVGAINDEIPWLDDFLGIV